MRVTFATRYDGWLWYGGAETQAAQTALALQHLGVEVEFFTPLTHQLGTIVHFFGMYEHYKPVAHYCRRRAVPTVLSTIFYHRYVSLSNVFRAMRWMIQARLGRLRKHPRLGLLWQVNYLLPNSQTEARQLQRLFGIPDTHITVVPNGVETRFAHATPELFRERFRVNEEFVLNVGRIESRKNQLRLIRAIRELGVPLIILGQVADPRLYKQCLEVGKDLVRILPPLPHDEPLLASAYAACRVFALPSLLETPGIAALEAGVAGARLVVTPVGGAKEYFKHYAVYPKPTSVASIREAIAQAWSRPHDAAAQREHLLNNFSWERVAQHTLQVYQRCLREAGICK